MRRFDVYPKMRHQSVIDEKPFQLRRHRSIVLGVRLIDGKFAILEKKESSQIAKTGKGVGHSNSILPIALSPSPPLPLPHQGKVFKAQSNGRDRLDVFLVQRGSIVLLGVALVVPLIAFVAHLQRVFETIEQIQRQFVDVVEIAKDNFDVFRRTSGIDETLPKHLQKENKFFFKKSALEKSTPT